MAASKYVDLTRLTQYDSLIKNYINTADAKAFKTAKFDETTRTLKLFKAESPADDAVADFTVEIPETDISGLLEKITDGTVGNVVTVGADGIVVDSGVAVADIATKDDVEAVEDKADTAQSDVDALAEKVGTVEDGQTVMGIIQNIQENAYDDTELRGLISDNAEAIEAHKDEIDGVVTTLVGDDTNKSVRTIANEELAAQLIGENAKESLDTLEEIAAWIQSHPDDASAMNKAIKDLEALVGTLPEDTTATTVVAYIDELIAEVKATADSAVQEVKSGTTNGTISVDDVDVAVTGLGSAAYKSETDFDSAGSANAAETNAKSYTDTKIAETDANVTANADAITELQGLVGEGITPITEDEINALFTTSAS